MSAPDLPSASEADLQAIGRFIEAIWLERGLSKQTLQAYRTDLALLAGYQARSTARLLSCLRGFYRHALREGLITEDPTLDIAMPQLGRPLPASLSEADVEALLAAPDVEDTLGLRDRCMLVVLYAYGWHTVLWVSFVPLVLAVAALAVAIREGASTSAVQEGTG